MNEPENMTEIGVGLPGILNTFPGVWLVDGNQRFWVSDNAYKFIKELMRDKATLRDRIVQLEKGKPAYNCPKCDSWFSEDELTQLDGQAHRETRDDYRPTVRLRLARKGASIYDTSTEIEIAQLQRLQQLWVRFEPYDEEWRDVEEVELK